MKTAWPMVSPGGMCCLHGRTRAHILKADATGPSVPAIMGNAAAANHHRLDEVAMLVSGLSQSCCGEVEEHSRRIEMSLVIRDALSGQPLALLIECALILSDMLAAGVVHPDSAQECGPPGGSLFVGIPVKIRDQHLFNGPLYGGIEAEDV